MQICKLIGPALLIFVAATATIGWSQDEMIIVDNSVFDNPQRTPSRFEHDLHNEAAGIDDCAECHHVYEDGAVLAMAAVRAIFPIVPAILNGPETWASKISAGKVIRDVPPG